MNKHKEYTYTYLKLENSASRVVAVTISLVRSVAAIINAVTPMFMQNAFLIVAVKLIFSTCKKIVFDILFDFLFIKDSDWQFAFLLF